VASEPIFSTSSKLLERVRLELARSLAREAEPIADLLERLRPRAVEAEAKRDDGLLALVEER